MHHLFDKKEKLYIFSNSKVLENGFIYKILLGVEGTVYVTIEFHHNRE